MAYKAETLQAWQGMKPGQPILEHMSAIPYKSTGSSYGACGIRIDGNPAFVDAVLSHLKELIDGENHVTRLELSRQTVDRDFKHCPKAEDSAEVCYIRLHMRGHQGALASAVFDRHLAGATERFAKAQRLV